MSSATPLPRRRPRVTARALVLVVIVVGLIAAIFAPVRQYLRERSALAQLEQDVVRLEAENELLHGEIERLHDDEYIEYLARKCLGMVKKGEIAFVTVPEGGEPQPPDC